MDIIDRLNILTSCIELVDMCSARIGTKNIDKVYRSKLIAIRLIAYSHIDITMNDCVDSGDIDGELLDAINDYPVSNEEFNQKLEYMGDLELISVRNKNLLSQPPGS